MVIDINPIIRKASDLEQTIMETYNYDNLYLVEYANGEQLSIKFNEKELKEFKPDYKVSKMLIDWEKNITSRIKKIERCFKTGLHPNRTYLTKEGNIRKDKMNESDIKSLNYMLSDLKNKQGKINFIKIIPN